MPFEPLAECSGIDKNISSSLKGKKSIRNASGKPKNPNKMKPNNEQLLKIYDPKRYVAEKKQAENEVAHKMSTVRHLQSHFESGQLKDTDNFRTKVLHSSAKHSIEKNTDELRGSDGVLSQTDWVESHDEKLAQKDDNKTHNVSTNLLTLNSDAGPSTFMSDKVQRSSLILNKNEMIRNRASSTGKVKSTGCSNYLPTGTKMNANPKSIETTVKNSEIGRNINSSVSNRKSIGKPKQQSSKIQPQKKHIDENRLSMYTPQRYKAQKTHTPSSLLKKDRLKRNDIETQLLQMYDPKRYAMEKKYAENKASNVDRTQCEKTSTLLSFKTRSIDMSGSVFKSNMKNLTNQTKRNVANLYGNRKSCVNVCPDDDKLRSLEKQTITNTERTLKMGTVTELDEWDSAHVSRRTESIQKRRRCNAVPSHSTSLMNRKRSLISIYSSNFVTKNPSKKHLIKKPTTSMMRTEQSSHDIDCRRILIRIVHEDQEKTQSNKFKLGSNDARAPHRNLSIG